VAFDAKKMRLSVPSAFRAVLAKFGEQDVVLRPSNHSPCIDVWPKDAFQAEVDRRTRDLDPFSEDFDTITDGLTVKAYDTRVDADGRVVLPRTLLADVPLDANAVIVGRRSFFQIWPAPAWAERQAAKPQPRGPAAEGVPA
jgi:transcriptional regulator MraZ